MTNQSVILGEISMAIHAYRSKELKLIGLINRLDELVNALGDTGYAWKCDIEDYLLQMDTIFALVVEGDKNDYSKQDISDIESFLTTISEEINDRKLRSENESPKSD